MNRHALPLLLTLLGSPALAAPEPSSLLQLADAAGVNPAALQTQQQKAQFSLTHRGLFSLGTEKIQGKETQFVAIAKEQFNKDFMLYAGLEQGHGEKGVMAAFVDSNYLFFFRRAGDFVQLVRKNLEHVGAPGSSEARSIARSFESDPVATVRVYKDTESLTLVPVQELFGRDLVNALAMMRRAYEAEDINLGAAIIEKAESFPRNFDVQVQLLYARGSGRPVESSSLSDGRVLPLRLRYSVIEPPDDAGFTPREADSRIGHMVVGFKDESRPDMMNKWEPQTWIIQRWNLQKKDPHAAASEVVQPIEVWLEDTWPKELRPSVHLAFEEIKSKFASFGLLNAIVVKEADDPGQRDQSVPFNPADLSYAFVVRYITTSSDMATGVGTRYSHPLTGQIFKGILTMTHNLFRGLEATFDTAARRMDAAGARLSDLSECESCSAATGLASVGGLQALPASEQKRFLDEYIRRYILHEAGHVLGLRHNFAASSVIPFQDLGLKDGGLIASSVMDYFVPNFAPKGRPQGAYYQTRLGPYDEWALEYAYRPLSGDAEERRRQLKEIADRAKTDPLLAYGSDSEGNGPDPRVRRRDLGDDPIAFAEHKLEMTRDIWGSLRERAAAGQARERVRMAYYAGWEELRYGLLAAASLIGGRRVNHPETYAYAAAGNQVYEPVPADKQREALELLKRAAFSVEWTRLAPDLLNDALSGERDGVGRAIQPVNESGQRLFTQKMLLDQIHSPAALNRLVENPKFHARSRDAMPAGEVLGTVTRHIWSDLTPHPGKRAPADPVVAAARRALQSLHAEKLIALYNDARLDYDAKTLIDAELRELSERIDARLGQKNLAREERAHLERTRRLVGDTVDGWVVTPGVAAR